MRFALVFLLLAFTALADQKPDACLAPVRRLVGSLEESQKSSNRKAGVAMGASVVGHVVVGQMILNSDLSQPTDLKNGKVSNQSGKGGEAPPPKAKGDWSDFLDEKGNIKGADPAPPKKKIRTQKELIADAEAALKLWKETRKVREGVGSFFIQSELHAEKNQKNIDAYHFELDQSYSELLTRVREIGLESGSEGERFRRVDRELHQAYFTSYCLESARITELLIQKCGNCVSSTLLGVSSLVDSAFPIPKGYELGVQIFSDHVQPVLYNRAKDEVIEIVGGRPVKGVRAPIYSPAILYADYLKSQKIQPKIDYEKDLLLAKMNLKEDPSLAQAKKKSSFGTNALLSFGVDGVKLPAYSQGDPPKFGIQAFGEGVISQGAGSPEGYKLFEIPRGMSKKDFEIFLSPRAQMARNPVEVQAVNENPLGLASLGKIRSVNSFLIHYPSLSHATPEDISMEKERRVIYFNDPALKARYESLDPIGRYQFVKERMMTAFLELRKSEGYSLLKHYLKNPSTVVQLSRADAQKIEDTFLAFSNLDQQISSFRVGLFHRDFSHSDGVLSAGDQEVWKDFSSEWARYLELQSKDPRASIQFIDRLPDEERKNFFKLNAVLGAGQLSGVYRYASDPKSVRVLAPRERGIDLEKVVYITLDSKENASGKASLEKAQQGVEKNVDTEKVKEEKDKDLKEKKSFTEAENNDALAIKPETMLGLILSSKGDIIYGLPQGHSQRYSDDDYIASVGRLKNTSYHIAYKQWREEFGDLYLREFSDGRFDDELVEVMRKRDSGASAATVFKVIDHRTDLSPRSVLEGGRYSVPLQLEVSPQIAEALKNAYRRRFGNSVEIRIERANATDGGGGPSSPVPSPASNSKGFLESFPDIPPPGKSIVLPPPEVKPR